MPGLIDTNNLNFGEGLQWQDPLGGGGLTIVVNPTPGNPYVTEDGLSDYVTEDGLETYITES